MSDGEQTVQIFNGIVSGQQATLGVNYGLPGGLPIEIFGGVSYVNFQDITVESFGVSQSIEIAESGINGQVGVRLAFSIGGGNSEDSSEPADSENSSESE